MLLLGGADGANSGCSDLTSELLSRWASELGRENGVSEVAEPAAQDSCTGVESPVEVGSRACGACLHGKESRSSRSSITSRKRDIFGSQGEGVGENTRQTEPKPQESDARTQDMEWTQTQ